MKTNKTKRKVMTQEEIYIHLLKIHIALQSAIIPNTQAVLKAGLANHVNMARHYLKRMEGLKMVKKMEHGFYEVTSLRRSPRFIKMIAKRVNYPNISYNPKAY